MKLSYAQNLEDVILWRVFSDVECGVYIDVGANGPVVDSVTKLFYDAGWRGVNIEPILSSYEELGEHRPGDINIRKCATSEDGQKLTILKVESTGLSTGIVENKFDFQQMGHEVVEIDVQGATLSTLWEEAYLKDVHFLKIDVEGMEKDVISGIDFTRHRPWVVLVESIDPVHRVSNHMEWEYLLIDFGYEFSYFDGLNRFYVAKEKNKLKEKFLNPPNIVDDKILENTLHISRFVYPEQVKQITSLTRQLENMNSTIRDLLVKADNLSESKAHLEQRLETVVYENNEFQEVMTKTFELKTKEYELKTNDLEKSNLALMVEVTGLQNVEKEYLLVLRSRFWRSTHFIRVVNDLINRSYGKIVKVVSFFKTHGVSLTIKKIRRKMIGHRKEITGRSVSVSLTEGEKETLKRLTKS